MLEGDKIFLAAIKDSDTDNIVKWRNQPFVRERFINQELFTRESHKRWLETMVGAGKTEQFIIYLKPGKEAVGTVYLRDIDRKNSKAEYGIFIGEEEHLGKGIGSEAARLILIYAFETLHLHKVTLRVFATNKRAIASYKKAGFIEEGYFKDEVRIGNQFCDIIVMSILENHNKN